MTNAELLTAVKSHLAHLGEESERVFLPDIYPFIEPSLQSLARRVKNDPQLAPLLTKVFTFNTTSGSPSTGLFTGNFPSDLLIDTPFRLVYITLEDGSQARTLYSPSPLASLGDCASSLPSPYYSVVDGALQVLIPEGRSTSPAAASLTGVFLPTISTLPTQLNGLFIDEVIKRFATLIQSRARK